MTYAVIGDIHGHLESVQAALRVDADGVIFVGDFLDSFSRSPEEQIECLRTALSAVEEDRAQMVLGNHDASYLYDVECSGYRADTRQHVRSMGIEYLRDMFEDFVWLEFPDTLPVLITHAGVSAVNFDKDPQYITCTDVKSWLTRTAQHVRYAAGRARGGYAPVGGHLWCDWWREFEPIPAIRQIVGHSYYRPRGAYDGVVAIGDNYNIDCLGRVPEYMFIDDEGKLEVRRLPSS